MKKSSQIDFQGKSKSFRYAIRRYSRAWMGVQLFLVDIFGLLLSSMIAISFWAQVNPTLIPESYVGLIPLVLVFTAAYALTGLYPAIGVSPVDEFRRLSLTTTVVFFGLATISFWARTVESYSRASFGIAWILALFILPSGREIYRTLCARAHRWGEPVVLIGYGAYGKSILEYLLKNPKIGLSPRFVIHDFNGPADLPASITPIHSNDLSTGCPLPELAGIRTAILILPELPEKLALAVIEKQSLGFSHLITMTEILPVGSVWVTPYDVGGILGLEIRQNLFSHSQQALKRVLDLGIILIFLPIIIPVMLILALFVVLDSPGNAFFTHLRVGHNGKPLYVWKFRTMVKDADKVLAKYLAEHPEQNAEWESARKIKKDPRITRTGLFYRKLSLDELPQLWNVIKGEMSLVGPRPIVTEEIKYYKDSYYLYTQVKPGLTGMWQISGRNDLTYDERVRLDAYYVRNWSIWLDIYILARTLFAVLSGKGAY